MKKTVSTNKGIIFIPLFFIIPLVIVGAYFGAKTGFWENMTSGIRKFLAAPSPSLLPQQLGQWQQEPTTTTPTPTLKLKGEVQTKPYVFKPETGKSKTTIPSFTITAPSGWVKIDSSGNEPARFESTEIDSEKIAGGTITTNAVISVKATDGYGSLDDFVSQYKASGSSVTGYQLVSSQSRGNGQVLELTYQKKIGAGTTRIHELNYLFFQDGISFLVKGFTSDTAWDKHAGEIQSALNSFKFN